MLKVHLVALVTSDNKAHAKIMKLRAHKKIKGFAVNKAMVFLLFVLRIRRPSILGFLKKNKIAFTYFFYSHRLP